AAYQRHRTRRRESGRVWRGPDRRPTHRFERLAASARESYSRSCSLVLRVQGYNNLSRVNGPFSGKRKAGGGTTTQVWFSSGWSPQRPAFFFRGVLLIPSEFDAHGELKLALTDDVVARGPDGLEGWIKGQ